MEHFQDVAEFSSDWCSVFCLLEEKEKKERKRNGQGSFVPGPDMPCWLCCMGFLWMLSAIKDRFKGQSLNFMCT
jgi:hypothetical protein